MRRREVELSLVLVGVALLVWWSRPPTPKEEMYNHLAEGIARYNWGYYTESLDHYNWVLDHFPRNQDALIGRARTNRALGWEKRSLADYRRALDAKASPRFVATEIVLQEFHDPTAYDCSAEAYRLDPTCALPFGRLCNQLERWDEAEKALLVAQQQGEYVDDDLYFARSKGADRESYLERLRKAGSQKLEQLLDQL